MCYCLNHCTPVLMSKTLYSCLKQCTPVQKRVQRYAFLRTQPNKMHKIDQNVHISVVLCIEKGMWAKYLQRYLQRFAASLDDIGSIVGHADADLVAVGHSAADQHAVCCVDIDDVARFNVGDYDVASLSIHLDVAIKMGIPDVSR